MAQDGGGDPPAAEHSAARIWNEQLLDAIRKDIPKPPAHARNLFHLSVAMWDAWAAYEPDAVGYLYTDKATPPPPLVGGVEDRDLVHTSGPGGGFMGMTSGAPTGDPTWSDDFGGSGWGDDENSDNDDEGSSDGGDDEDSDEDDDEVTDEVKVYDEAVEAARAEAISFAAYRLLKYRFPVGVACHPGGAVAHLAFDAQMDALGYDKTFTSTEGDSPAALGNRIAALMIAYGQTDGANEGPGVCYPDDTGYAASNPTLIFKLPGNPDMFEPNHWQPLAFDFLVLQNGIIIGAAVQSFVGVGWGDVTPFGLTVGDIPEPDPGMACWTVPGVPQPYFDPGCPPQLASPEGDAAVKEAMLELIRFSSWTDPAAGVLIDVSPGAIGNNSLGADDGEGHPVNPATGQPYAPNVMNLADWVRVVAQSWSDGPQSETPPGHWNVIANEVLADNPALVRKIGGTGPTVNFLEWDVKVYLALNGAVHDAAITAWSAKNYYDSSRPISLIRYMGGLGQSSDPGGPSYHPDGLLLEPGLVEVITPETVEPGGKFEDLAAFCHLGFNYGVPCETDDDCPDDGPFDGVCQSSIGKIAVRSWLGPPADPENETSGVGWRLAGTWMPFFPKTFVTPPFPGYTSGHSTFSRSGAEVLAAITGDPYFPGGLGHFEADTEYLEVEDGPSAPLQLQWATFYDAADEAGISRRFGGIHPTYDDFPARIMGSQIGQRAYEHALQFYGPQPATGGGEGGGDAWPVITIGSQGAGNSPLLPQTGGEETGQAPAAEPGPGPEASAEWKAQMRLGHHHHHQFWRTEAPEQERKEVTAAPRPKR
jgi:hypothetical protein